jgi:hypothetical protein
MIDIYINSERDSQIDQEENDYVWYGIYMMCIVCRSFTRIAERERERERELCRYILSQYIHVEINLTPAHVTAR